MKKIYLIILALSLFLGSYLGISFASSKKVSPVKSISSISSTKSNPTPTTDVIPKENSVSYPQKIIIPSISVYALIEYVSVDSKGNMDIPKDFNNTAWYSPGPKPGEKGSAVIDGHVDDPTGAPSVFANLSKLKIHDTIQIIDDTGKEVTFEVQRIETYDLNDMPLKEIFSQDTQPMLNLITCAGTYSKARHNYSHRTVVYSTIVK